MESKKKTDEIENVTATVEPTTIPTDNNNKEFSNNGGHGISSNKPTSYLETMMHLFKGNVGPGLFAMGDAFKNAGILLAPIMTLILGIVCVHSQHVLVTCANKMKQKSNRKEFPDFADTVELCFENGPSLLKKWSANMKTIVNIFLCVTQFGFCCVYFVFISSNLKKILEDYDIIIDQQLMMLFILVPILLPSLITNLKYLAPFSTIANIFMIIGIGITLYFSCLNLPDPSTRKYFADWEQLPLFFGTAIYAFEGISLVLPLQNSMKTPTNFNRLNGVLNVGMSFVTTIFIVVGFIGYLKYGEDVEGSLTLNLPKKNILAQSVKLMISISVLLGYALQFFVAIQIMWPGVRKRCNFFLKYPLISELLFRTLMVIVTFSIAELVPKLSLFISLIGALCSTSLCLVFPPVIELVSDWGTSKGPTIFVLLKNIIILLFALLGFVTGTYESIASIIKELTK